jgi:hypothetical protein
MKGTVASRPPRKLATSLTAVLLALALGPLLLEFHSTPQAHSPLDQPVEIFTDAVHPTQPAHFDAAASEERERCTYCVLQLLSAGSLQSPPALVALVAEPLAAGVPVDSPFPACASGAPSSTRGPPAAPVAA